MSKEITITQTREEYQIPVNHPDWPNALASDEDIAHERPRSKKSIEDDPMLSDYPQALGGVAADAWINGDDY